MDNEERIPGEWCPRDGRWYCGEGISVYEFPVETSWSVFNAMDDDTVLSSRLLGWGIRIPSFDHFQCVFNVSRINPTLLDIQVILPSAISPRSKANDEPWDIELIELDCFGGKSRGQSPL